jgi:hypothetical protein
MTLVTLTVAHWHAQKMRRYPRWGNYAYANASAYASARAYNYTYAYTYTYADAYADAYTYTSVGRYNLTCANGGTPR